MQVSMKWLHDYIDFKENADVLADKLTMAGIPVENVVKAGEGLEKVITGKITKLEKHPDSDHLQICTIDIGNANPLTIVTGAQNVAEGQIVPVAQVGAHLPCGKKISKGKLRGIASNGMLCGADEMGMDLSELPESQKIGIYILPQDTPVGIPVKEALGLDDDILEFELTANRGDCFSVFGLVREVAVLTGGEPKWPQITVNEDDTASAKDLIKTTIEADDLCDRFSMRVLKNIKIAPSPEWMQARLKGAGIRPINNVVDVTNFVMVELGQPMHAYDYDQISGHHLTVRKAAAGENLHTLDDTSRLAKGGELVIADDEKAAGLAGIMGGYETEITENTTTIALEAASFNGPSIRRTSRDCGLHSEASGRFERGVDVSAIPRALDRAAQLLQDMGSCTITKGIVDIYPSPKKPITVKFTADEINNRLGTNLSSKEITDILDSLELKCDETPSGLICHVPSWRNDITLMEDLSEEVARIYGFDKIESSLPGGGMMQGGQKPRMDFVDDVKDVLVSLGMDEELSFGFTNEEMYDKLNIPEDSVLRKAIPIMNPLTDEYPLVRTTLLSGIFDNLARNFSRKNNDVRLFEVAPVFFPKALPVTELPDEVLKLAGSMTGRRYPVSWNQPADNVDFYDTKGVIEEMLHLIGISKYTIEPGEHYAMHPGKTAVVKKGKDILLTFGEVHPAVMEHFDFTQPVYIFEADIETLMKYTSKKFKAHDLPRYPAITRDLALIVDTDIASGDIERTIKKNAGGYLKGCQVFDVYTALKITGKKSIAFTMQFQSDDKTLTDEDADKAMSKVMAAVKDEFGAVLRS